MNIRLSIMLLILLASSLRGQTTMVGDLSGRVDSHISSMPGRTPSNLYQPPSSAQLNQWGIVVSHLLRGNLAEASANSASLGYLVVRFVDTTTVPHQTHYLLEKDAASSNYWGMYVFNPVSSRPTVAIQSPHPLGDTNTGKQGFYIYKKVGARAFFISGTHRCNSTVASGCSGTTSVCSEPDQQSYRISDQAHVVDGMFQQTTAIMNAEIPTLVAIQVHGFGKLASDPDIIMGNGTSKHPTDTDHLNNLKQNLLKVDPNLTFKIPHIDVGWTRLTGSTNTQGRLINDSPNHCTTNPSQANGRFLHIEQALSGLRDSPQNWDKLATGIAMTFQAVTSVSVTGGNQMVPSVVRLEQNYPNPFNPSTVIAYELAIRTSVRVDVYNILGQRMTVLVDDEQEAGRHTLRFDSNNLPGGIYVYAITTPSIRLSRTMVLMR